MVSFQLLNFSFGFFDFLDYTLLYSSILSNDHQVFNPTIRVFLLDVYDLGLFEFEILLKCNARFEV